MTSEIFVKNLFRGIPQSLPPLSVGQQSNTVENFTPSYRRGKQRRARLFRQPSHDRGFRYGTQCLRKHVGIKNDHVSNFTGSRVASRGAISNSTPPNGSIRARMESTRVPLRGRS